MKIYKYIYIFGGFTVAGTMKKKKRCSGAGMGYCPFFFFFSKFESQYIKLYCNTGPGRHGLGDRPGRAAGAQ